MSEVESEIYGKNMRPKGITPAIAMINPKNACNVGAAVRAASCFGARQVWFTGNRVKLDPERGRLPREERMKGYKKVELRQHDYIFEQFGPDVTPVAVEVRANSENLMVFEHPENPLYVFGPEDGNISQVVRQHCHRYVIIPTAHCTNLAAAVYIMLYDRMLKRYWNGDDPLLAPHEYLDEERGNWPGDEAWKGLVS